MRAGRLLRVVPARDGGWDVVGPGLAQPMGHGESEAEALEQARQLLQSDGGGIQVLNRGGFVTARHPIAPPPASPRAMWIGFSVQLLVSMIAALALGFWLHSLIPAGAAFGGCIGRLVMTLRPLRVQQNSA